jgi:hypothetical protein
VKGVLTNDGKSVFNMQEVNLVDDGKHVIVILVKRITVEQKGGSEERIEDNGFQEVDVAMGKTVFKSVIGMVWSGLVWGSDQTRPSHFGPRILQTG